MSITPPAVSSQPDNDFPESHYTYQDLHLLGQFSPKSPLRIIALLDFDAFYAQCETVRLGLPRSQPLAVQQFKAIIALNYPARAAGLKRGMPAREAKLKCPDLYLQHVATWREGDSKWAYRDDVDEHMNTDKSALDPYRTRSRTIFDLIKHWLPPEPMQKMEKASIDEVYIDLSAQIHGIMLQRFPELQAVTSQPAGVQLPPPSSSLLNWDADQLISIDPSQEDVQTPDWDDVALCIGAEIVRALRRHIFDKLHYTCSAGVARNKTLAKLGAGRNKPNQQTIIRNRATPHFLSACKLTDITGLGGKYGSSLGQTFGHDGISDLLHISLKAMQARLGDTAGYRIFNLIRGVEYDDVVSRIHAQSMLSAKTFTPNVQSLGQATRWLRIFAADLFNRLVEQDLTTALHRPRSIATHHQMNGRFGPTRSKQASIPCGSEITADLLFSLSRSLLVDLTTGQKSWPCVTLSVSVFNFEDRKGIDHSITSFLSSGNTDSNGMKNEKQVSEKSLALASRGYNVPRRGGILTYPGFAQIPTLFDTQKLQMSQRSSIPGCRRHHFLIVNGYVTWDQINS